MATNRARASLWSDFCTSASTAALEFRSLNRSTITASVRSSMASLIGFSPITARIIWSPLE